MERSDRLLKKRVRKIGMFFEIKKQRGLPSKVAVIEIAEALSIGPHTVNNDLAKYNRWFRNVIYV